MWLAIRYRRTQALVLLVLSALITTCAVLAPLYDRAMQQALTRLSVDSAPAGATTIEIRSVSRFTFGLADTGYVPARPDDLAGTLPAVARTWFSRRVDGASLLVVGADQTPASPVGALRWRDGACANVVWVAGGCPARAWGHRRQRRRRSQLPARRRLVRPGRGADRGRAGRQAADACPCG